MKFMKMYRTIESIQKIAASMDTNTNNVVSKERKIVKNMNSKSFTKEFAGFKWKMYSEEDYDNHPKINVARWIYTDKHKNVYYMIGKNKK